MNAHSHLIAPRIRPGVQPAVVASEVGSTCIGGWHDPRVVAAAGAGDYPLRRERTAMALVGSATSCGCPAEPPMIVRSSMPPRNALDRIVLVPAFENYPLQTNGDNVNWSYIEFPNDVQDMIQRWGPHRGVRHRSALGQRT